MGNQLAELEVWHMRHSHAPSTHGDFSSARRVFYTAGLDRDQTGQETYEKRIPGLPSLRDATCQHK